MIFQDRANHEFISSLLPLTNGGLYDMKGLQLSLFSMDGKTAYFMLPPALYPVEEAHDPLGEFT